MSKESAVFELVDEDELLVEKRADGKTVIRGYAVVYNRLSVDMGGFRERIMPGAFDGVLKRQRGRDLISYFNHDQNYVLGRESNGTLNVWSDDRGVGFEATPPDRQDMVVEYIQKSYVKGASFTFSLEKNGEAFVTDESGRAIREVRAAKLYELGPVVQPAYPDTNVGVAMRSVAIRSYEQWMATQEPEIETPARVQLRNCAPMLRAARLRSL